jgi:hypothetical protein
LRPCLRAGSSLAGAIGGEKKKGVRHKHEARLFNGTEPV